MAAVVRCYDTARFLGDATKELERASLAAEPTGAISAYRSGLGVWIHVPESQVHHHRKHLKHDVVIVYVERE